MFAHTYPLVSNYSNHSFLFLSLSLSLSFLVYPLFLVSLHTVSFRFVSPMLSSVSVTRHQVSLPVALLPTVYQPSAHVSLSGSLVRFTAALFSGFSLSRSLVLPPFFLRFPKHLFLPAGPKFTPSLTHSLSLFLFAIVRQSQWQASRETFALDTVRRRHSSNSFSTKQSFSCILFSPQASESLGVLCTEQVEKSKVKESNKAAQLRVYRQRILVNDFTTVLPAPFVLQARRTTSAIVLSRRSIHLFSLSLSFLLSCSLIPRVAAPRR